MSYTTVYIIFGIVILHFAIGIGYVIYKLSGGKSPPKKE